jgi:uncharacterized protein
MQSNSLDQTSKLNANKLRFFDQQSSTYYNIIRMLIYISIFILSADFIYKTVNNITYLNRSKCFLYKSLPKIGFLFYEYFIELTLVVLIGIFASVILESYFMKLKHFYPRNPVSAFLYASVIPVCACSVIPLTLSMRDKLSFRTIITFVVSAPLLNPYIIMISFSVLGMKYGILRIISSFILAYFSGVILDFFYKTTSEAKLENFSTCFAKGCTQKNRDLYLKTFDIFKQVFPYLVLAGVFGILTELYIPVHILKNNLLTNTVSGPAISIAVGIPVYFCNGADVLFLRPLLNCGGLSLGAAMAFSLTSTSICMTSFIMLIKFIGKKLTILLLLNIILITFVMGLIINLLF